MKAVKAKPAGSGEINRPRRLTRPEAQALTRRRLLDAAAEVFGDKGFRAASLTDVADRAGYTIGAVYSNFATKDELFRALMSERLWMAEAGLAAMFPEDDSAVEESGSFEERIETELDRIAAAENSVPPRWWRLLYEYRTYAATDPIAWAEQAEADRRCREIMARGIERFASSAGIVLPRPAIQLAELGMALTDGLRAAYADGRSSITSGEGLRMMVKAFMATSERVDPA